MQTRKNEHSLAEMSSNPLNIDDLAAHFAAGCKSRTEWKIGTEHEKIGFCKDSLRPIPYEGERSIRRLLEMLASDGWELQYENSKPIALMHNGASITLEPGGQLELSGAPLDSIHATCAEVGAHLRLLRTASHELGIRFLGMGFQPKWTQDEIPWMPKARYQVMREYMPKVGKYGLDMMLRTATVQANLDYASEQDMVRKMRVAMCLQPLVTAMYAASPFVEGGNSDFVSYRAHCWKSTDPARTGIPAMIFDESFGFEAYARWALDAPMYFIMRDGTYIDCQGQNFSDFIHGKLPSQLGQFASIGDWDLHCSTLFPDVRLRTYLEMRGADAGPWPWICSLPALWKGLLYDEQTLSESWQWIADWTHAEVLALREEVCRSGFKTPFRDQTVLSLCEHMIDLSRTGLERLNIPNGMGENESIFLKPLQQAVAQGQNQADRWVQLFATGWNGDIDQIFEDAMFL